GLEFRLARAREHDGDQAGYRAALEDAIRINPHHRQAQTALAKVLIESGRYEEAYAHYQRMFAHLRPDVDSLINYGLLAAQLSHETEALNSWQQALALDPDQINAQLYLADAFAKRAQFREAIPHYDRLSGAGLKIFK